MAQDHLQLVETRFRKLAPLQLSSRAALCWAFGLLEGSAASAVLFLSAFTYHVVVMQVAADRAPYELYAAYSTLVGVLYGGFSAIASAKFLDKSQHPHSILADSALGWTGAFGIALLVAFLGGMAGDLSRVSLTSAYIAGLPLLLALRNVSYSAVEARIREGRLQYHKVSVIGDRFDVVRFLLNGNLWKNGYQLIDTLYFEDVMTEAGVLREGALVDFARSSLDRDAEYIVFVGDLDDVDGLERIVVDLKRFALNIVYAPATSNTTFKFLDVVPIGPNNALRFLRKPMSDGAVLLKRSFDIVMSGLGLVLLSPFFAVVALLIRLEGAGPVFFRQERRGFNGDTFFIWKFRSMRATESGAAMRQAKAGDPRITPIGRFLRSMSIDELPQLINVLLGTMSLVGPRPHAISHDAELSRQLARYAHRQRIKPGITGWAQVNGYRGDTSTFEQVEGRTAHDLYYIENWSIFLDCWILALTVFSAKTRRNAV
ncbi:MAG: exopolysaccharide biosynthesis polyprenyl glycosylphosphotransferase [Devosia sp.]|nr:exopolysaccharide biosynthesis polyprenyl glycosylphosphotransferase [Devosia sp.]